MAGIFTASFTFKNSNKNTSSFQSAKSFSLLKFKADCSWVIRVFAGQINANPDRGITFKKRPWLPVNEYKKGY